jgi:tetratricopeptide (TPR) repeat protein
MTLHKLKVAALQHEQREEWGPAIELYRQALREAEGASEGGDPSLYNRIGDLAHKSGDDVAACEAWEQAVIRYGELGFLNSAIALVGKILRVKPDRLHTYLELARLQARKRVLYDVRRNLQIYLSQMGAIGRDADARTAAEHLGNEFPGWRDLDALLDELLGRERGAGLPGEKRADNQSGGRDLVFLDTAPMEIERAPEPVALGGEAATSVVSDIEFEPRPEPNPIEGFEPTTADEATSEAPPTASTDVIGLVGVEQTARGLEAVTPMSGLESNAGTPVSADEGAPPPPAAEELVFLKTDEPAPPPAPPLPEADANDPLGQRVLAHALLEHGDRAGGITALERSLQLYQEGGEWVHAYQVATELIQAEPAAISRNQSRVEIAARMRDAARLCDAYVELGDALVREGSADKAVAVYRRILELDDSHERARTALRAMNPDTSAATTPSGFIDLGAMLIDDHPRSTRMRTETPDIAPDEDETFRDALAEFKRALDQNLPIEDHQAHYDLGIAFKEMGLLDEAISEFQKALRAPQVRLRTSEALGEVFFDQGRPAVAETVLRGVENSAEGDAEKIGVLYWLGRSLEAQGRRQEAVTYYQRIIAVDIGFRDASARLAQQSGESPR